MTQRDNPVVTKGRLPRRSVLLASVAGIGLAALVAGTGLSGIPGSSVVMAQAAEATQQQPAPAGFADIVARVKPAVISVIATMDKPASVADLGSNNGQNGRNFGFNNGPNGQGNNPFGFFQFGTPNFPQKQEKMTAEGSGFFISPDGYAVTNNHVVGDAKTVQVIMDNGSKLTGHVVGTDKQTDLALIKVGKMDNKDFPYVQFASHNPRIGDWVIAVGNPFGLGGTVTAGVVSAEGRDLGSTPYNDFIQIDAPINRGNSGGPAFDINGNVIGVNTAIYSPSGGSVGIGFDIPADTAKMVVAQLEKNGHVTRGWMGVQIQTVTPAIADGLGLKKVEGAIVDEPQAGSPAANAGLKAGDVIVAVDGKEVKGSRELARTIAGMAPGTKVQLGFLRDGQQKNVSLELGTLPGEQQANAGNSQGTQQENGTPRLGLTLAPAGDVEGSGGKGVAVTAVDPNGPAAQTGMKAGDVILDVAGKTVNNPTEVRQQLTDIKNEGRRTVLMRVKSGDATRFIAIPFGKA
jgi:serine protease Do